ncbi:MAG: hypothetical protein ACT4OV_03295 [Microthrixaceae bacterium]
MNRGAVPTLVGGIDLGNLEPSTVLVGADLAFGSPLPSEAGAAEAFVEIPEVAAAVARRVYVLPDVRHAADVVVLALDGAELFDEAALDAFTAATVASVGGATAEDAVVGAKPVLRAASPDGNRVTIGFREQNLFVITSGGQGADVTLVATRQIEARARGEVGSPDPSTPLVSTAPEAAFVEVPTVTFAVIPPPQEEVGPVAPTMAGVRGIIGRYGVVAGERRTVVWAISVDLGVHPTAEALDPAARALATSRGGTDALVSEVGGRVVYSSTRAGDGLSAQVFRHLGLVLLVEGEQPEQVDAVVTAWIAALGPA